MRRSLICALFLFLEPILKFFFSFGCAVLSSIVFLLNPVLAKAQSLPKNGLAPTIEHLSSEPNANSFELGMLQTLRALEQTLQTRYEYGLGQSIPWLPVLRIGGALAPNPTPKPSDAGTLSDLMRQFVVDINAARTTLLSADPDEIDAFDLSLRDLWFDVDGNGRRTQSEDVTELLGALVIGRQAYSNFTNSDANDTPLSIRFDAADHAWLVAYTHMLSGFGHLFLAFDPEPVFQNLATQRTALVQAPTIPNTYDQSQLEADLSELEVQAAELKSQRDALQTKFDTARDTLRSLREQLRETPDGDEKDALEVAVETMQMDNQAMSQELNNLRRRERFIRNERQAIRAKQPSAIGDLQRMADQQSETIDAIFVLIQSLDQQPDVDHIRAVHENWMGMITHNRTFWSRLSQETDNEREWIPNATQTSLLPLTIPNGVPEAWQAILSDVEDVLKGNLLITHPLLPPGHGISIPAYVENPSPLSLVDWIHGISAYPYAAKGPRLTEQSWNAFQRLTNGNPSGFAIFFN